MYQLLKTIQSLNSESFALPEGKYAGLLIRTTDTELLTGTDLASSVQIKKNGFTFQNFLIRHLWELNSYLTGEPIWVQTVGNPNDTIEFSLFIPFSTLKIPNALKSERENEISFDYTSSNALAGSIEIFGLLTEAEEKFVPKLLSKSISGAGEVALQVKENNVACLWIIPETTTDTLYLERNSGQKILSENDFVTLLSFGSITGLVKSIAGYVNTPTSIFIDLLPNSLVEELSNDGVRGFCRHALDTTDTLIYLAFSTELAVSPATAPFL